MNFHYVSDLILDDFYTRYSDLPYRLNGNTMFVDPTDGNAAKTLDQVNDCVELSIFPQETTRKLLTGTTNGRWITGFVRFNAFDKKESADTKVNGARTDEILGAIDTLYSEQTISDSNASITFETANIVRVGMHPEYQRYEGFMRIKFTARLA